MNINSVNFFISKGLNTPKFWTTQTVRHCRCWGRRTPNNSSNVQTLMQNHHIFEDVNWSTRLNKIKCYKLVQN